MQLTIGEIYEGRIKAITQYGAFVEVADTEGGRPTSGMVHISEIADSFVRDIHDFVHEEDVVRVKVIGVNPQGKISMSIRQVEGEKAAGGKQEQRAQQPKKKARDSQKPRVYEPKRTVPQSEMSFEDKLLHFKQASEEKICDLRRGSERRGGSRSRRS